MYIQCDCGKFRAELIDFNSSSPGRLVCYCDDCQSFLKKIKREDILDAYGGTEIIPIYPNNYKILQGEEYLKCNALSAKGLKRWTVTCCNTPVGNTMAKFPWIGIPHKAYTNADSGALEKIGQVRSRVKGKFKTSEAPFEISDNLKLKDALAVIPFVLKGFALRKFNKSPLFKSDGFTPIKQQEILP